MHSPGLHSARTTLVLITGESGINDEIYHIQDFTSYEKELDVALEISPP
jgi:hypothetical protein